MVERMLSQRDKRVQVSFEGIASQVGYERGADMVVEGCGRQVG